MSLMTYLNRTYCPLYWKIVGCTEPNVSYIKLSLKNLIWLPHPHMNHIRRAPSANLFIWIISMLFCVMKDFNFTSYCGMLKSPISRSMTGFYITCETLEFSSKSCLNLSSWIFFEVWTCSSGCVKTNQSWPIFCHFCPWGTN